MSAVQMARITTREQLDGALARRKTMSHLRLGDALVQENLITAGQRDAALADDRDGNTACRPRPEQSIRPATGLRSPSGANFVSIHG